MRDEQIKTIREKCPAIEAMRRANTKHGHNRRTGPTRTYMTWAGMLARCTNPKEKSYARYGGRGIRVCVRWRKFENFLADMGAKPAGLTIERKDNSKGYSPTNCRWATVAEQNRNRRNVRRLTYEGHTQSMAEWAREFNLNPDTLASRLKAGWSVSAALVTKRYGAYGK